MNGRLQLQVLSPEGELLNEEAESVRLPAVDGSLGILRGHVPMVAALKAGRILYRREGQQRSLLISGGLAEVRDDRICVLVDTPQEA